jgi:hypothetical protein
VENEWPVKYKAIGPVQKPNYVLIGDEQTDHYMEGFSISFNATSECHKQDFRQNMLFYDFSNQIIIDKSGYGIEDIRKRALRFSCAPFKNFDDWANADMTLGQKALRYVKFVVRAKMSNMPLEVDHEESAFVATLLKRALRENGPSLKGCWFGYVLGECLRTQEGIQALYAWVCTKGGASWWTEWLPFVEPEISDPSWLNSLNQEAAACFALDSIKRAFETNDKLGDGLISETDLKIVFRNLGGDLSEDDFEVLFQGHSSRRGTVKFDEFVDYLCGVRSP